MIFLGEVKHKMWLLMNDIIAEKRDGYGDVSTFHLDNWIEENL